MQRKLKMFLKGFCVYLIGSNIVARYTYTKYRRNYIFAISFWCPKLVQNMQNVKEFRSKQDVVDLFQD